MFQSRFQDSFQIKLVGTFGAGYAYRFQSRFQDSFQIKLFFCLLCQTVGSFNPVSRIRFKSSKLGESIHQLTRIFVSIPFPGFVSNQAFYIGYQDSIYKILFQSRFQDSFQIKLSIFHDFFRIHSVSIPFPGFVSNQVLR